MINPFRPLGASLRDLFDEFLLMIACNVLWCLISLPLLWMAYIALTLDTPFVAAAIALLAVLPAGPATAGLYAVAYRVADGRATKIAEFFSGMRRYARQGWLLLGIWTFGMLVILFDIAFYARFNNLFAAIVFGLWVYLLIIWLALLIYVFPLVLLQEQPDLRTIARNAALMVFGRPIFTLITMVLMIALLVISIILAVPVFIVTIAFLALYGLRATRTLIEDAERRRAAAQGQDAASTEEKGRKGQVRPK